MSKRPITYQRTIASTAISKIFDFSTKHISTKRKDADGNNPLKNLSSPTSLHEKKALGEKKAQALTSFLLPPSVKPDRRGFLILYSQ
jgi:hypothetical protein